jgi:hypothetical protein
MNIRRGVHLVSLLDRAIGGLRFLDEHRDLLFTAGISDADLSLFPAIAMPFC